MPFRREFAEIALAGAREMQVAQSTSTIFADRSEPPVYSAALAGAADLPDEVGAWALEMARRRPYRKDVVDRVTAFRRQEAEKRAERMRTEAAYRKQVEERRSLPMSLSSVRKFPPWPLGGKGRLERDFRECCAHTGALSVLMRVRPQVAAEVLLAASIEDSPKEDFSSGRMVDDDYGLSFDSNSYPTAFWKGPFLAFLQIDADAALTALLQLVDFCTERWAHVPGKRGTAVPPSVTVTLGNGQQRKFVGNVRVFDWPQSNSNRSGQLHCALAALEFWLCSQIDSGGDVAPTIERLLQQSNSAGMLGVLVNIGKHKRELFIGMLRPLLASRWLYEWDDWRVEKAGPYHFDAFSWARQGEAVFQMARQWVQAPYRQVTLRKIAVDLITRDSDLAAFVSEAVDTWELPSDAKGRLECRILAAELDAKNYKAMSDGRLAFVCPEGLQRDFEQYNAATGPTLQTLVAAYQCEKVLAAAGQLSAEQAAGMAAMLQAIPNDTLSKEDTRRSARIAIAAARAVERLHRRRWVRADREKRTYFRRPATARHSEGLDTHILGNAFSWLVGQRSPAAICTKTELEQDRRLLLRLWDLEVWRHADDDGDAEHRLPSELGDAVLEGLAAEVARLPAKEAADLWRPVLSLGPDWHDVIGHFLICWFGQLSKTPDMATFVDNWKAMLGYALSASGWTSGRRRYYGERLIRQLLGFGSHHALTATFNGQPLILQVEAHYRQWANKHLQQDEDNIAGLCGFLESGAGKPLRLEGLDWISAALQGASGRWHRERVGSALLDFLDTMLSQDAEKLTASAKARQALVDLAALLVARQVPNALPLHGRIQKLC